jgi:putative endonuclease
MGTRAVTTRATGSHWEDAALSFLASHGLKAVARNFNCRYGEIDLILRDSDSLVFAEVRYRDDARHGGAAPSVGATKQGRLVKAASLYLQAHPELTSLPCRFDVVGCSGSPAAPRFEWIRGAFEAF